MEINLCSPHLTTDDIFNIIDLEKKTAAYFKIEEYKDKKNMIFVCIRVSDLPVPHIRGFPNSKSKCSRLEARWSGLMKNALWRGGKNKEARWSGGLPCLCISLRPLQTS